MHSRETDQKAIIAIVKGGLGNQLFIYAAARAMALRTGRSLYLDTRRGYTHDNYGRSYRLDRFPIMAETMPEAWRVASTLKHPRHKFVRAWNKCLPRQWRDYVAERHHLNDSQLTALVPFRERVTLHGYWQNEHYFADYADRIRTELAPPEPMDERNRELGWRFSETESISLHVRRVRYSPLLSKDYYQWAIDAICRKIANPHFVLFGDDFEWPLSQFDFKSATVEIVNHNPSDELADLWLMTQCRHAVTANSSFSWWGAWLGGAATNGREIIAPRESGFAMRFPDSWTLEAPSPIMQQH